MAFVFYDTETTGTDAAFDQILHFAAIRTDPELNEIDRFEIRSRLLPHVVPAPDALLTNRISVVRLCNSALPSHYEMVRAIRERLISWSPALFMGYNSLRFDEHFLRQALYQTLHSPFLTNTNGNSRSDALRMVQTALTYAPEAIRFPIGDNGKTSLRLELLAPANGFAHTDPHDAMSDVEATIHICRLLSRRAPELWSMFMRFSQKAAAAEFIVSEPVFCLSEYYGEPRAWLVAPIGHNPQNSSEHYVFDLTIEPEELRPLTIEELGARLARQPRPLRRLAINAAPVMLAAEDAPSHTSGRDLRLDELRRRADTIRDDAELCARLIAVYEAGRRRSAAVHVEQQIYDGFIPKDDEVILESFHAATWEDRVAILEQLQDRRMLQLGRRLIFTERPNLLIEPLRTKLERMRAERMLGEDELPWRTLGQALFELEGALAESVAEDMALLQEYKEHLLSLETRAKILLDGFPVLAS